MATLELKPTSVISGSSSNWYETSGTTTNRHLDVDDYSSPDDTDYIYIDQGSFGEQIIKFDSSDSLAAIGASDTINHVTVYWRQRWVTADPDSGIDIRPLIFQSSTTTYGSVQVAGSAWGDESEQFNDVPGGTGWTKSDLTGLEFGLSYPTSFTPKGDTPRSQVSYISIVVDYTSGSGKAQLASDVALEVTDLAQVTSDVVVEDSVVASVSYDVVVENINNIASLANSLVLDPPATADGDRYPPTAEDATNTVGTWTGSYASVDEFPFTDSGYVYIAGTDVDVSTWLSRKLWTTDVTDSEIALPAYEKVRLYIRHATTLSGDTTTVTGVLYKNGVAYESGTATTQSTSSYKRDNYFEWDTCPWGTWGALKDISFGVRITAHTDTASAYRIYCAQLFTYGVDGENLVYLCDVGYSTNYTQDPATNTSLTYWGATRYLDDDTTFVEDTVAVGHVHLVRSRSDDFDVMPNFTSYGARLTIRHRCTNTETLGLKFSLDGNLSEEQTFNHTTWQTDTFEMRGNWTWDTPFNMPFGVYQSSVGAIQNHEITFMKLEFYPPEYGSLGNSVQFESYVPDWWDANYLRRQPVEFNASHDELPVGSTVDFEIKTGYEELLDTLGAANESVVHAGRQLYYSNISSVAYPDGMIVASWLGNKAGESNYWCYYAIRDNSDGTWTTPVAAFDAGASDVHYYPVIAVDKYGYILTLYGTHRSLATNGMKFRRSTNPEDVSSWGAEKNSTNGLPSTATYPRIFYDSAGEFGRIYCVYRGAGVYSVNTTGTQRFCYSDDSGDNWTSERVFAEYEFNESNGTPSLYCGGVHWDNTTKRLHVCLCFWDSYGGDNKGRAVAVVYTDDMTTWKSMDGTSIGTTANNPESSHAGVKWGDFEGTGPDLCWLAGSVASGNADDQDASWYTTGPFMHNNNESLAIDSQGNPHCVWTSWTTFIDEPCRVLIASWDGTSWGQTVLTDEGSSPLGFHRRIGVVYADGADIFVYAFVQPETLDEQHAAEVYKWKGAAYGTSWSAYYFTSNTAEGLGMMSVLQDRPVGEYRSVLLSRGKSVYYWPDIFYPFVRRDGDDVRVIKSVLTDGTYYHTQYDRLPDRFQAIDTSIFFKLDVSVPVNATMPREHTRYWVYYNNPNATTPLKDPQLVNHFYESWETHTVNLTANGTNGWLGDSTPFIVHDYWNTVQNSNTGSNKLYSGSLVLKATGDGVSNDNTLYQTVTSNLTEHEWTYYIWSENSGQVYFYLHDTDGSKKLSISQGKESESGSEAYKRYDSGSWSSIATSVPTTAYNKWRVVLTSGGVSVYLNDTLILDNDTFLTQAKQYGFGCKSDTGVAYIDSLSDKYYIVNEATLSLGTLEATAFTPDPTPAIANLAQVAYIREVAVAANVQLQMVDIVQIMNVANIEATDVTQITNKIIAEMTSQAQIANLTVPEASLTARIASRLMLEEEIVASLSNWLVNEATFVSQLMSDLSLQHTKLSQIHNALEVEDGSTAQVANDVIIENEVIAQVANKLNLEHSHRAQLASALILQHSFVSQIANWLRTEATAQAAVANAVEAEATSMATVANSAMPEATTLTRISNSLIAEESLAIQIANAIVIEKLSLTSVANIANLQYVNVMQLAHALVTEASVKARVANLVDFEATPTAQIANWLQLNQTAVAQIANLLNIEKTEVAQLACLVRIETTDLASVASSLVVEATALRVIANNAVLAAGDTISLANSLMLDAPAVARLCNMVAFAQADLARIVNMFVPEASTLTTIANSVIIENEVSTQLSNWLQLWNIETARLAGSLVLESLDLAQLPNQIALEISAMSRLSNSLDLVQMYQAQIVNALLTEKHSIARLGSVIYFIAPVEFAYFRKLQSNEIRLRRVAEKIVGFGSTTMKTQRVRRYKLQNIETERTKETEIRFRRTTLKPYRLSQT